MASLGIFSPLEVLPELKPSVRRVSIRAAIQSRCQKDEKRGKSATTLFAYFGVHQWAFAWRASLKPTKSATRAAFDHRSTSRIHMISFIQIAPFFNIL
jgi:hypothetical protein